MKEIISKPESLNSENVSLIGKVLTFLAVFFTPVLGFMAIVGAAILFDTGFGYWKAKKLQEKRTSRLLISGVLSKMLLYQLVMITGFLLDKIIFDEIIYHYFPFHFVLSRVIAAFLVFLELYSIDEKMKLVTGVGLFDRFSKFTSKTKSIVKKVRNIAPILGLIFIIHSCNTPEKLIQKAIKKDPSIVNQFVDTVVIKTTEIQERIVFKDSVLIDNEKVKISVKVIGDSIALDYTVKADTISFQSRTTHITAPKTRQQTRLEARNERRYYKELFEHLNTESNNERKQNIVASKQATKQIKAQAKPITSENKKRTAIANFKTVFGIIFIVLLLLACAFIWIYFPSKKR